jgi:predicted nucleotidyltransferase
MAANQQMVQKLEASLGCDWSAIRRAQETTAQQHEVLDSALKGKVAHDTSVVLFGSIARGEVTSGSDADWILLIDGQAVPEHENQRKDVADLLEEKKFGRPGRSGVFGCMVGSHSLVHEIGGEDDTNSNTTRRILLLLESLAVGDDTAAHTRVRQQILNRYLQDDNGLLYGKGPFRVPRFLLNDVTRYWRTITVDFVYKQRSDAGEKWALRNAKLRLSRKLVFTSGLLRCFFCHLDPRAEDARQDLARNNDPTKLAAYMESELIVSPLELLARAAARPSVPQSTAKLLFDSYNGFLDLLDNEEDRKELAKLRPHEVGNSKVWTRIRVFGRDFQTGLTSLFFGDDEELKDLMIEYGVF